MSTITWQNLPQTNFTDSNQMTALAMQAWDNALKTAQTTVANASDSIKNQNEAKLQQFINSIPKEDWQASQEQINDEIAKVASQTGNMFDPKVIEAYRDGRGNTLITRDNTRLQNEENALALGNKQLADNVDKTVQKLISYDEIIDTATGQDSLEAQTAKAHLMEQLAKDPVFGGYVNQAYTKTQTEYLTQKDQLTTAQMLPDMPDITTLSGQLYDALSKRSSLTAPSDDATQEQKQAYQDQLAKLNEIIQTTSGLLKPYQERYGEGKVNQVFEKVAKEIQEKHTKLYGTPYQQKDQAIKKYTAEQAVANNQASLALQAQELKHKIGIDNIKTDLDIIKSLGGGDGSGSGKATAQSTAFFNQLKDLGLETVYDPKTEELNLKNLSTGITNKLNKISSKKQTGENTLSYNEWLSSKEGIQTSDNLFDQSFEVNQWFGKNSRLEGIKEGFKTLEANGEKLSEQEKIATTIALSAKDSKYARYWSGSWTGGKDDAQTAIKNTLADIRSGKANALGSEQKEYFNQVLNTVGTAKGLSEFEVYNALKEQGDVPSWVLDLRPDLKNQAVAHKQMSNVAKNYKIGKGGRQIEQ